MRNFLSRIVAAWLALTNRYEGAVQSTSRSWVPAAYQSARFDAGAGTRKEIVRKSRYFERNSDLQNRLGDLFECYTVGSGLQLTPASSSEEWNKRAKTKFERWCLTADISSGRPLSSLEGLAARTWWFDGEAFVILTQDEQRRPGVQLVEGHLVETPPDLAAMEGDAIIDGALVNQYGRPVAWYIAREDKSGTKIWGAPTPAEFVVHVTEPSRPGMLRGLPFCYPVLNKLHDLDDLQILAMKAAKEAARHINFVTNAAGEVSPDQLRGARYGTTNVPVPMANGGTSEDVRREYYESACGGETIVGKTGDKLERLGFDRPGIVEREYWKDLKADVCSGQGIPYVVVYPESMQGTVYRGALDSANAFFCARFQTTADMKRRVYRHWANWARYNEPELRDAPADWDACIVHQPRAINVDVGYNMDAMLKAIAAGAADYGMILGPQNLNFKEVADRLAMQREYLAQKKIVPILPGQQVQLGPDGRPVAAAAAAAPDPDMEPADA